MSPQLGGYARDLEDFVKTLQISDGEPVLEYYLRALKMYKEIKLQRDGTGQDNRLIRRFVTLLFVYNPFMECLRPVMTLINAFFLRPNNHLQVLPIDLPEIYNSYIRDNCAPLTISRTAKYSLPSPQISMLSTKFDQLHDEENKTCERDIEDENDEKLVNPTMNAARFGKTPSSSFTPQTKTSTIPYNPTRCKVCGMTQKECHQAWNNMHDPSDPTKCCFRGPIFNPDKNIRENVLQYNLKHPEVPQHGSDDKDKTKPTTPPHQQI